SMAGDASAGAGANAARCSNLANTIPQRGHSLAGAATSAWHFGQVMATYCFVTSIVPATTSLPLAFARSVHVPELFFASNVRASATSASSLGGKSYLAFMVFPSNDSVLKLAL